MPPWKEIAELIRRNDSFLVTSHVQPDGDAVGSMAGFGFLLEQLGKDFTLFNPSGLPEQFGWVTLPKPVVSSPVHPAHDIAVVLDCGDASRLDEASSSVLRAKEVVNIDHHTGNTRFGSLNWVEPERSATGEMVAQLVDEFGLVIRGSLGEAIYLALMTDTGSFTYSNTRPETLHLAARIVEAGLDLDLFNARMQRQWTLNKARLHGAALQGIRLHAGGSIGVISVSQALLQETGTSAEDCEGLVNYVRRIRGVVVAVSLRQESPERVKFSLRSWGELDVQAVAAGLGGGGHRNAAGGVIEPATLPQAEERVVHALAKGLGAPWAQGNPAAGRSL